MFLSRKSLHQLIAVTPLNHIWFMNGYAMAWVPQVLSWLSKRLTTQQSSLIGSLYYIGRAFGPLVVAWLTDRVGRNLMLRGSAFLMLVPWLALSWWPPEQMVVQYVARLMVGLASSIQDVTSIIYIGENCSAEWRALFNSFVIVYFMLGSLTAYAVGHYFSYAVLNGLAVTLGLITLASTGLLLEPANFLIMKGRFEMACRNFHWLRDTRPECRDIVNQEFEELKEYVVESRRLRTDRHSLGLLSTPEARKSLRVIVVTTSLVLMTGYSAVNSYFTVVLAESPLLPPPSQLAFVSGCVQFALMCCSSAIVDRFNRRTLLLGSHLLLIVVSAAAGLVFHFHGRLAASRPSDAFVVAEFALLTAHVSLFTSLQLPLLGALRGELLPQNVKAAGSSLALVVASCAGFIIAQIFLPISHAYGVQYNFYLYAVIAAVAFLYIYVDVPETRGETLLRIQENLMAATVCSEGRTH